MDGSPFMASAGSWSAVLGLSFTQMMNTILKFRMLLFFLVVMTTSFCSYQSDGKQDEVYRLVREGDALLLDVRTPQEYAQARIEGARNIPVQELPRRIDEVARLQGGDRDKTIVVYCTVGARAARAKEILQAAGFTRVINLGGISDWPGGS